MSQIITPRELSHINRLLDEVGIDESDRLSNRVSQLVGRCEALWEIVFEEPMTAENILARLEGEQNV